MISDKQRSGAGADDFDCASFHPAVAAWFRATFSAATEPQRRAWPAIQAGQHVLIAAPTGSGKTLAAFLTAIDALVRRGVAEGLPDQTQVVYVSPLKALSNDIQRNLEQPLAGIREQLQAQGFPDVEIRTQVRTGDTPQSERQKMVRCPPHIIVTTPESLYILLTSDSGRRMLASTQSVIVDEIHALAPNKRGAHLALTLARLDALCGRKLTRIGLSATQRPIDEVARFLIGADASIESCAIVDSGHVRGRDLGLELPSSPLAAVMSNEVWQQVYDRLAELVRAHRTTLVFVNTRRSAERVSRHLSERLGEQNLAAHHGSLAKEKRLAAEQRLKRGELQVLVATSSLELGIDIGDVDLVCQLSSPRAIAAFLQRAGRANHAVTGTPKARLFPSSRDDLVECMALLDAVRRHELDALVIPDKPLDVLAQTIVAEVTCRDWDEAGLYELMCCAWPYRALTREAYTEVVKMLADGISTRRGQRSAYLHRDAINGVLRARRGARLTAVTNGGTIPDNADYQVLLEPENQFVGTVNEDFAVESMAGDIFQLGNTSYRILRVEGGRVRVADAHGEPPSIPFWIGEAPARSPQLSFAVSRLRDEIAQKIDAGGSASALRFLLDEVGIDEVAAQQVVDYCAAQKASLGSLPTQRHIMLERFFDEAGGTQLVIHSPFGGRINRAWGLSLRKRFCRKFNFELQAAATEDAIVLSLTTTHSFPLIDASRYLHSASVRPVLIQALLDAPMFNTRWRWNAGIALALARFRAGKKIPPQLQRMDAEDLVAAVFPDQIACAENLAGEREIPDHPLVRQTIDDCLHEAMDIDGLEALLRGMESGELQVTAHDTVEPSPFALEILSARPYAFLDDAPLEERRTQAVMARRWLDPETASDLGKLDDEAIARVREEAWPDAQNADELHDALSLIGFLTGHEIVDNADWPAFLDSLAQQQRVVRFAASHPNPPQQMGREQIDLWIAAERLPQFEAVFPSADFTPRVALPADLQKDWQSDAALIEIIRGRSEGSGPFTASGLAGLLGLPLAQIDIALVALEAEGCIMRGQFTNAARAERQIEWCDRRLLARIHRYTVKRLRAEIEPVSAQDFLRFLFDWQHLDERGQGPDALAQIVAQLEGFEAPAAAWESEILPARIAAYDFTWLDALCQSGRVVWTRLSATRKPAEPARADGAQGRPGWRYRAVTAVARASAASRSADQSSNAINASPDQKSPPVAQLPAPGLRRPGPVRSTPIALLARRNVAMWNALANKPVPVAAAMPAAEAAPSSTASPRAVRVANYLAARGASFFDELLDGTGLLHTQLEEALGELVALGLANCDSFSGLRALLAPPARRAPPGSGKRRRTMFGIQDAGRWSLLRRPEAAGVMSGNAAGNSALPLAADTVVRAGSGPDADAIEHIARTLLRRYGVVFWRMLGRESDWLPPWRDLLRVYRRLEARGEIRGGRFVARFSGEQFALPEAIGLLRELRKRPKNGSLITVSGADPLNLAGIVTPGAKLPALAGNRLLYRDGVPVAFRAGGQIQFLGEVEAESAW
ncbi:MAG: DEAD/DEAH box helicase, partial [Pseudomonadota bacterium]|nr:DEAD/DEAH box helicase [Pseudomonadota bacterium]